MGHGTDPPGTSSAAFTRAAGAGGCRERRQTRQARGWMAGPEPACWHARHHRLVAGTAARAREQRDRARFRLPPGMGCDVPGLRREGLASCCNNITIAHRQSPKNDAASPLPISLRGSSASTISDLTLLFGATVKILASSGVQNSVCTGWPQQTIEICCYSFVWRRHAPLHHEGECTVTILIAYTMAEPPLVSIGTPADPRTAWRRDFPLSSSRSSPG